MMHLIRTRWPHLLLGLALATALLLPALPPLLPARAELEPPPVRAAPPGPAPVGPAPVDPASAEAQRASSLRYSMSVHLWRQDKVRVLDRVKWAGFGWIRQGLNWDAVEVNP